MQLFSMMDLKGCYFSVLYFTPQLALFSPFLKNGEFHTTIDVSRMQRLIFQQIMLVYLYVSLRAVTQQALFSTAEKRRIVLQVPYVGFY